MRWMVLTMQCLECEGTLIVNSVHPDEQSALNAGEAVASSYEPWWPARARDGGNGWVYVAPSQVEVHVVPVAPDHTPSSPS